MSHQYPGTSLPYIRKTTLRYLVVEKKYRPAAVANAPCVRRGDAVMGADWAQSILEHVLDPERPHSKAHLRQNAIAVTPSGAILLPACRSTWVIRYHL